MSDSTGWKLAAAVSTALATGTAATLLWREFRHQEKEVKLEKWVRVGTVSEVMVYPVKSCKGSSAEEVIPTDIGFKVTDEFRDRVFMVVNEKGEVRRQTHYPKLALITPVISLGTLTLSAPEMETIVIAIPKDSPSIRRSAMVFTEPVACVLDCGPAVSTWLSTFLGDKLFLYYHHLDRTQREKLSADQQKFAPISFSKRDKGTLQDETSYMFVTEESIADLNKKLASSDRPAAPATFLNFRPNIVVSGTPEPFSEDQWGFVRIGDENGTIFKAAQPCLRCMQTAVNYENGTMNDRSEPLRTIHTMKRKLWSDEMNKICKAKAVLGLHLGLHKLGSNVKKGDPVYAAVL